MDCFLGASTGTFKAVDLKSSKVRNVNSLDGLVPKEHGIVQMCFADSSQNEIFVAQRNGQINVYSAVHDTYSSLFNVNYEEKDNLIALQVGGSGIVITADSSGHIRQWSPEKGECNSVKIDAGRNLQCLQVDPLNVEVVATGGRENQLRLWDLEKGLSVFTAKNLRDNVVSLREPTWVTNARFVNDSKQICTTTGHHQIRLYDPKVQRRPILELKWGSDPITALSTCHRSQHVIAGNSRGELSLFDLRNKIRPIQKYRGFAGSVRSIYAHPTEPIVAACGIDRFLMVHNVERKNILKKIYCKTLLNCLLLRTENSLTSTFKKTKEKEQSDEEMEPSAVTSFFKD